MATSSFVKEEYLSCVICSEVFREPTTLYCNHTFCQGCLIKFVRNKVGVKKTRGIPCPVCRQITPVPDPKRPVEQWVLQFRPNFYIVGLIEALDPEEKDCSVCKTEGKNTKATSWCHECDSAFCDTCLKVHSKIPASRSHEVIEISSVSRESIETKRHRFCEVHKDKLLEVFCKDCDVLLCSTCLMIKHRKCENIITVAEAGKQGRSGLKERHDMLALKLEKHREKLSKIKELKANFYERQKTNEKSIKETANKIVDEIREKETVLLQELTEISEREIKEIDQEIKTMENITKSTLQNIQLIKQLMTSGSDCDVISQQKNISQTRSPGDVLGMSVRLIDFEFNSHLSHILDMMRELTLGELSVNKPLKLEKLFNTRMMEDVVDPILTDIIVLKIKAITVTVVTDHNNLCLKCFYTKHDKTCSSRVDVGGQPWNVTKLSRDMIAVSMVGQSKICLIRVTPDLRCHSTINTKTRYTGLTAINQNTLAAGSYYTHSVHLIDLTGKILTSVTTDETGQGLFYDPRYLCLSPTGDVIVSDWKKKAVICQTQKGDVQFRYQPDESQLCYPHGVSCDQSGDVFVVDSNLDKVTKITQNGEFVQDILTSHDGLKSPSSACYHDNRLYVVQSGEIRVFILN